MLKFRFSSADQLVMTNGLSYIIIAIALNGCVVGFQPKTDQSKKTSPPVTLPAVNTQIAKVESKSGQRVHGLNGLIIEADLSEIGEKKTLSNQIIIEGVFYE